MQALEVLGDGATRGQFGHLTSPPKKPRNTFLDVKWFQILACLLELGEAMGAAGKPKIKALSAGLPKITLCPSLITNPPHPLKAPLQPCFKIGS